jgi:tRNA A-37 threonylcarbamoyl transferase component Bud32
MSDPLATFDRIVSDAVEAATGHPVSRTGRPRRHEWSLQVPYRGDDGRELVAKVPMWDDVDTLHAALAAGPQPATRREYGTLVALAERAHAEPGLVAVAVVAFAEAANTIVMERLDATPLSKRLGWGRGTGDLDKLFGRVGRAVRMLHEATGGTTPGGFDPAPLGARLAALAASPHLPARAAATIGVIGERCAALAGRPSATAVLHGDLSQANVLVGGDDRVAIIDPNHTDGDVHVDAAHLLTDVTTHRDQLLTGGLLRPFPVVRAWGDALAEGHGGLDRGVFDVHSVTALLERWAAVRGRGGPIGPIAGLVAGRVVELRVRSLTEPQQPAG